jgi:hypothetical protein
MAPSLPDNQAGRAVGLRVHDIRSVCLNPVALRTTMSKRVDSSARKTTTTIAVTTSVVIKISASTEVLSCHKPATSSGTEGSPTIIYGHQAVETEISSDLLLRGFPAWALRDSNP